MSIKDFFKRKKENETVKFLNNLENKDSDKIRLMYVYLETFARYNNIKDIEIGHTYGVSSLFKLPEKMTMLEACKVVSYLSDKVERENKLQPGCEQSVGMVSNLLEKYGFEKVDSTGIGHYHVVEEYSPSEKIKPQFPVLNKKEGVVDFFTVGGNLKLFKNSEFNNRYFEWYSENVNQAEIENIYKNISKEDLINNTQEDTNTL